MLRISLLILLVVIVSPAIPDTSLSAQVRYRDVVFSRLEVKNAIAYGSAMNRYNLKTETLLLDLYAPKGDTETKRPAVVVVHGGGLISGSRSGSNFQRLCQDFAGRGYVAVTIDYRLVPSGYQRKLPESAWDAQEDTKAAMRYLRRYASTYCIDAGRIAAIGSSAGGYCVVMAAYYEAEGKSGNPGFPSKIQAVTNLWGGTFDVKEIEAGEAPLLIVHGTKDPVHPYQNALDLAARCKTVGIPVDLHPLPGLGHEAWSEYSKFLPWSLNWNYRHLTLSWKNGLRPHPGFSSPGSLTLDIVGTAEMDAILFASFFTANIDLGPLGVVGIDPMHPLLMMGEKLPSTPGIAVLEMKFSVPSGLVGITTYWQAVLFDSGTSVPATLTNVAATGF